MFLLIFCINSLFSFSFMWADMYHFTSVEGRIKILHCTSVPTLVFVPVQLFNLCETQKKAKSSFEVHSSRSQKLWP